MFCICALEDKCIQQTTWKKTSDVSDIKVRLYSRRNMVSLTSVWKHGAPELPHHLHLGIHLSLFILIKLTIINRCRRLGHLFDKSRRNSSYLIKMLPALRPKKKVHDFNYWSAAVKILLQIRHTQKRTESPEWIHNLQDRKTCLIQDEVMNSLANEMLHEVFLSL